MTVDGGDGDDGDEDANILNTPQTLPLSHYTHKWGDRSAGNKQRSWHLFPPLTTQQHTSN